MTTATPVQSKPWSKARDPRTVELSPRTDGTFGALSSDGSTIYTVRSVGTGWQCHCPGYASRETCCHTLAAAAARTCAHCGELTASCETFRNGWDGGRELVLCSACCPAGVK